MPTPTPKLFVRSHAASNLSYNGFVWPRTPGATVESPEWDATPSCGGGLHAIDAKGDARLCDWSHDAVWLIVELDGPVEVEPGKWKAPRAKVVAAGDHAAMRAAYPKLVPAGPFRHGTAARVWEACVAQGPATQDRAAALVRRHPSNPSRGLSTARLIEGMRYILRGFAGFREVSEVTRYAAKSVTDPGRYVVEVRPAKGGKWSRSAAVRFVPVAAVAA